MRDSVMLVNAEVRRSGAGTRHYLQKVESKSQEIMVETVVEVDCRGEIRKGEQ